MDRNVSEIPDRWVILKISINENKPFYKVFGSWFGGYLDGDRWKINSGVSSVEEDDEYYYFNGLSGSCYKCHKEGYGVSTSYNSAVLEKLINSPSVELMDDDTNWFELTYSTI